MTDNEEFDMQAKRLGLKRDRKLYLFWQAARSQKQIDWIDVEDRLPESKPDMWSDPVIALADNGEIFELMCMGTYWQRSGAFVDSGAKKVMCWIPFPKFREDKF